MRERSARELKVYRACDRGLSRKPVCVRNFTSIIHARFFLFLVANVQLTNVPTNVKPLCAEYVEIINHRFSLPNIVWIFNTRHSRGSIFGNCKISKTHTRVVSFFFSSELETNSRYTLIYIESHFRFYRRVVRSREQNCSVEQRALARKLRGRNAQYATCCALAGSLGRLRCCIALVVRACMCVRITQVTGIYRRGTTWPNVYVCPVCLFVARVAKPEAFTPERRRVLARRSLVRTAATAAAVLLSQQQPCTQVNAAGRSVGRASERANRPLSV